jgi:hypothetical protein
MTSSRISNIRCFVQQLKKKSCAKWLLVVGRVAVGIVCWRPIHRTGGFCWPCMSENHPGAEVVALATLSNNTKFQAACGPASVCKTVGGVAVVTGTRQPDHPDPLLALVSFHGLHIETSRPTTIIMPAPRQRTKNQQEHSKLNTP